jgi:hypothetical protein
MNKKLLESEDLLDGFDLNSCDSRLTFDDVKTIETLQIIDIERVN